MPKRLIQHKETGKYYTSDGTWTHDPLAAKDFSHDSLIKAIGGVSNAVRMLSSLVRGAFVSAAPEPLLRARCGAEDAGCSLTETLELKGESVTK